MSPFYPWQTVKIVGELAHSCGKVKLATLHHYINACVYSVYQYTLVILFFIHVCTKLKFNFTHYLHQGLFDAGASAFSSTDMFLKFF